MPYIEYRESFDKKIEELISLIKTNQSVKGQINYIVTRIVHRWVENEISHGRKNYDTLSEGYDVMCEAAAEYYREVLGKYENKAKRTNGCISSLDARTLEDVR